MDDTPDVRVALATITAKLDYALQGQEALKEGQRELRTEVRDLRQSVDGVPDLIDTKLARFVTHEAFDPVRMLVFGLVALVFTALVGAAMAVLLSGKGVTP